MSTPIAISDAATSALLEEVVGYLNFSSGAPDPKFLRALNAIFTAIEHPGDDQQKPACRLCHTLERRISQLDANCSAFRDVPQAQSVIQLLRDHLLPAYRAFHRDQLWHQSERELWRPLFLGRAIEAILSQSGPWNETERIVNGAPET